MVYYNFVYFQKMEVYWVEKIDMDDITLNNCCPCNMQIKL